MTVLNDEEIRELVLSDNIVDQVSDHRYGSRESQIQPSSLDLTVGHLRVPGDLEHHEEVILDPGHTAIVITHEKMQVPKYICAITFSPVQQQIKGILILNQGHVDPGFNGHLRYIVINMSNAIVSLRKGDIISSVLFFKMNNPSKYGYSDLEGVKIDAETSVSEKILNNFSPDFLDVGSRLNEKLKNLEIDTKIERKFESIQQKISIRNMILTGVYVAVASYILINAANWAIDLNKKLDQYSDDTKEIQLEIQELRSQMSPKAQ